MRTIYFILFLLLVGCVPNTFPTATPDNDGLGETEMPVYRFLALGDSYTIGESVGGKHRWPNQLAKLLEEEGTQTEVTVIARTGWTVDELWKGIQADPPQGTYDVVTLLIGVNDQYRGYPLDGYREDFRFLLGKAIEYAGGDPNKVVVLSIPDWGFTPFAATGDTEQISQQIDEFNAVNLDETKIAGDRLHPSAKMYTMWAEKVLPVAREILK